MCLHSTEQVETWWVSCQNGTNITLHHLIWINIPSCSAQLVYLSTSRFPQKAPSRHKHSKMDLCQKKMALHLHLHLHWLCACMNHNVKTVAGDTSVSQSSSISSSSTVLRGLLLSSPTAVMVKWQMASLGSVLQTTFFSSVQKIEAIIYMPMMISGPLQSPQ